MLDSNNTAGSSASNPFADINPDDPRLKNQSAAVRTLLKQMSDGQFNEIVKATPRTYDQALTEVDRWRNDRAPNDNQLLHLISGMVLGKIGDSRINDVFERINKRWKACKSKTLQTMRDAVLCVRDVGSLVRDNEPGAGRKGGSIINVDSHRNQVKFAKSSLESAHERDPKLFRYGTTLARVRQTVEEDVIAIQTIGADGLRAEINAVAEFHKEEPDESLRGVPVPTEVVNDVMHDPSLGLHYLSQIGSYPVFDPELNLIATDGYHPNAHLFLKLPKSLSMPRVSAEPTSAEISEALRFLIRDYLGDFPFDGYTRRELLVACGIEPASESEEKKSVPPSLLSFLAFLIQPLVRPVIGKSPLPALLVTKPEAGSGASLLVETARLIVLGQTSTRPAMPSNEEERRKQIFSALRSGTPFIGFDNVVGSVDSPVLASMLTSVVFTDRLLGKSVDISIPNNASVVITGNNPTFSRELLRRVSLCRIDAGVADPTKRKDFQHADLSAWVLANRGKLLWALCTLVMHHKAVGCPEPSGTPLASYGPWFKVCGGVFEALGWQGFQSNRDQLEQVAGADEEDPIRDLIQQWFDEAGKSDGMLKLGQQYTGGESGLAAFCDSRDITIPVKRRMVDGVPSYNPVELGKFLSSHTARVFAVDGVDVELIAGTKTKHGKPWSLRPKAGSA